MQDDKREEFKMQDDKNSGSVQVKSGKRKQWYLYVGVTLALVTAGFAVCACIALWVRVESPTHVELRQEDLEVIRDLKSLKNELNMTITDVIKEWKQLKKRLADGNDFQTQLNQTHCQDLVTTQLQNQKHIDELKANVSVVSTYLHELNETNKDVKKEFTNRTQQIRAQMEDSISKLATFVNESKDSFQHQLTQLSKNASEIHQQLFTELHQMQQQLAEAESSLVQKINETKIKVEETLDRQDRHLIAFNESLVQVAEEFRAELNETRSYLRMFAAETLKNFSALTNGLNTTQEQLSNLTEKVEESNAVLSRGIAEARNDTHTLRNEFIAESTSVQGALFNLSTEVEEKHHNLSIEIETRSNHHSNNLRTVNTTLNGNIIRLQASMGQYNRWFSNNLTLLANQASTNFSRLQMNVMEVKVLLSRLEDATTRNLTSFRNVIDGNNASVTHSLRSLETKVNTHKSSLDRTQRDVAGIQRRTDTLEHDQRHTSSDLYNLNNRVNVLHSSGATIVVQENKLIVLILTIVAFFVATRLN